METLYASLQTVSSQTPTVVSSPTPLIGTGDTITVKAMTSGHGHGI